MRTISVYWYDESIVNKLRTISGDNRIAVLPTDTLFRYVANLREDNVKFPLVALTRLGYTIRQVNRVPASYQGAQFGDKDGKVKEIQFIPIEINYQLDVITRSRLENDTFTDELLFYFINNPTLSVEIKKGANISHVFSMVFNPDVVDNSDIESHMSNGEYFRSTMTFQVSDAKMWKTTLKDPYITVNPITVIGTTDVNDSSKSYYKEIIDIPKGE